jgi:oxygen-independent coproporphyrinogen-3 oxidase
MIPILPADADAEAAAQTGRRDLSDYLRSGPLQLASLPPLSLYVHLPWCLRKCPYCDFNSHERADGELPEQAYVDALMADLEAALPLVWGRTVHSIFLGGGTPSLFSPSAIDRLLGRHSCQAAPGGGLRGYPGGQPGHLRERPVSCLPGSRGDSPVDRGSEF